MIQLRGNLQGISISTYHFRYLQASDSWCSSAAMTPDGRVFSLGGFSGITNSDLIP
jgi:hypothetical protein